MEIQQTSIMKWKNTVKKHIEENAFIKLENMKLMHSKVKDLKHIKLKMQEYFLPNCSIKTTNTVDF